MINKKLKSQENQETPSFSYDLLGFPMLSTWGVQDASHYITAPPAPKTKICDLQRYLWITLG